ncbi:MAG: hypothetical protein HY597_07265 [Candidatus Omnitrophica bacterium]|nr:hypothetical protein [Candidatus Omnitrophota bacterium]
MQRQWVVATGSCVVSALVLTGLWLCRSTSSSGPVPPLTPPGVTATAPISASSSESAPPSEPQRSRPTAAVARLPYRLVGTSLAAEPTALLESLDTRRHHQYHVGDRLEAWTLEAIRLSSVTLRDDAGHRLVMFTIADEASQPEAEALALPFPPTLTAAEPLQLQRRLRRDGAMDGVVLKRVDHLLPARLLDLRDGDMVTALNGQRLTSPQKAIQALRKARAVKRLTLDLERSGRTLSRHVAP